MSEMPNSLEEVTMPQDSINRNITETGMQGSKGSFPGIFLAAIQILCAFASFFGNVLITRIVHNLPDSRLRATTKLLMSYVSLSHCIINVVLVGRLFDMPCLLVLLGASSSGFNVLWGILFLAFEAFILVKKPYTHTRYVSVKICMIQILFSCLVTVGLNLAMYLTQKVPDDVSFCYMTNGILNPWAFGLTASLVAAMIICASVIQISTLRTLRKTSPRGTNTAASPPSNLQVMPNLTVHPASVLQQISSNVQVVPNCTVHQPRFPSEMSTNVQVCASQEMPSNVQAIPCTTASLQSAAQGMTTNVIVVLNPAFDPYDVPQEMSSNVQMVPNCTIHQPRVPQQTSSNVQAVSCTTARLHSNCTDNPPHVPQNTPSNVQSVPSCTVDPAHLTQEMSSNVQSVLNCTVDPPHVPQETLSNVQVMPNCTVDSPHIPQETLSNVIAVPHPIVHPPHVPQANNRNMSPLHKLTVILSISLLCFIICWLPICLAFIIFSLLEILEIEVSVEGKLVPALGSLTMLSGCLHVFVYVVMSTQIRQALKKYVKSWWCLG